MNRAQQQFHRAVLANVRYWQGKFHADVPDYDYFRQEKENVFRAIQHGLALPPARPTAVGLLLQIFPFVEHLGIWHVWLPLFNAAEKPWLAAHPRLQARLLNRLGQLHRLQGQFDAAERYHQEAETIAGEMQDDKLLADIWYQLSVLKRRQGCLDEATYFGEQALAKYRHALNEPAGEAAALHALGAIALQQRAYEKAEARLKASVALWQEGGVPVEQARVCNRLGILYLQQEQLDIALAYFDEAHHLLSGTGSDLDKVDVQINRGIVYYQRGQYEQAEMAFRLADLPALHRSGNRRKRAAWSQNLGNVLLARAKYGEAVDVLQLSRSLWQQIGDHFNLANTLWTLAEVEAGRERWETAVAYYDAALSLPFDAHPGADRLRQSLLAEREAIKKAAGL